MVQKRVTMTPPHEALPEGESNRYLAKLKTSLCKRWSSTRMETLYEIFDLAAFLWALERNKEALAIAASVAEAVPEPPALPKGGVNYNVWCPATFSHALIIHLAPKAWHDRVDASRTALLGDCGIARDNPGYLAEQIANAQSEADGLAEPQSMKWECLTLARHLGWLVLCSELAKARDPLFKPHSVDAAALIPRILARLQARLQAAR